jgi:3-phenylpropionate/trans-cinnamate dioxygenase ferredoxin reductase subunit
MEQRIVVIGAGHAGGAAAINLRELGFSGSITLVGEEVEPPYERPSLSKEFLSGKDAAPVYLAEESRWAELGVDLRLGVGAVAIDRENCIVTLSDGTALPYDQMILATGGAPRELPFPAHPRIFPLRTTGDAKAIAAAARPGGRAVVIGGGVIGLETASTLHELGLTAIVVEAGQRLLGRNVPGDAADWLAAAHARVGVEIRLGRSVAAIEADDQVLSLKLDDGESLEADLVVVGIGIVPRAGLAEAAGLPVGAGVLVDDSYRSIGDETIYAIGDLALRRFGDAAAPQRMETWAHAQSSARAAALAILGQPAEAEPAPWFWTAQCGHNLQILGDPAAGDTVVARGDAVRLYLREGILVGAACLDQPRDFASARRLIGKPLKAELAGDPGTDLRKAAA